MHTNGEMNECVYVLWKTKHYNRVSLFKESPTTFRLSLGSEVYRKSGSNTHCCNVTLDLCYWYMSTTKFVKSINRPPPYKYDAYVYVLVTCRISIIHKMYWNNSTFYAFFGNWSVQQIAIVTLLYIYVDSPTNFNYISY